MAETESLSIARLSQNLKSPTGISEIKTGAFSAVQILTQVQLKNAHQESLNGFAFNFETAVRLKLGAKKDNLCS